MNIFDLEVYEKKKAVPSARHKKNGSKSKKCKMSTDGLTERQIQKRNGEVMTYQLGRPMDWAEFKALPVGVQEKYLQGLQKKYNINAGVVGKMFGVNGVTVTNYLAKGGHDVKLNKKIMSKPDKEAFLKFINGDQPAEEAEVSVHTESTEKPAEELAETIPVASVETEQAAVAETKKDFKMSFFSLVFDGTFSREEFMRSIGVMIPDGADVSVKVKVEFNK